MAIKFGMTVADMIMQLTKGFMKATGRKPEALEKIKIQQEAAQRFRDMNKVVDMEGKTIDTSKGIMGGKQAKAMGGRIGYKLGSIDKARRAFLKTAAGVGGGIAALKTGLMGLSKKAPEAIETVKETVSSAADKVPPYFYRLVEKIRFMGEETLASQDKAIAKKYKDYVMEEDFAGNITIVKSGEDLRGNKLEDVYMSYKVDDVATKDKKGFARAEEYEEFTARPDAEGKMKDVEPGVPDEVVEEAGDVDAMTLKRAGGGIARMLGE